MASPDTDQGSPNPFLTLATLLWTIVGTVVGSAIAVATVILFLFSSLDADISEVETNLGDQIKQTRKESSEDTSTVGKALETLQRTVRDDFNGVRELIATLQSTVAGTNSQVAKIEGQIEGLTSTMGETRRDIAALQNTTTKTDSLVSKFGGQMDMISRAYHRPFTEAQTPIRSGYPGMPSFYPGMPSFPFLAHDPSAANKFTYYGSAEAKAQLPWSQVLKQLEDIGFQVQYIDPPPMQ